MQVNLPKQRIISILLLFFCLNITQFVKAQSDNCGATAQLLTSGLTCTTTTGNNSILTDGLQGCNTAIRNRDGWFRFVATNTTHTITVDGNSSFDTVIGTYTTCGGALVGGVCTDATGAGAIENRTLTGLTIGTTYFVTVYNFNTPSNGNNNNNGYTICVTNPAPPAPANDNCSGATVLIQTANGICNNTAGTVVGATTSTPATTCGGTADDDVWYRFVATNASATVQFSSFGGSTGDIVFGIYNGTCVTPGTPLLCQDFPDSGATISALTVGNTYFIRVYSWSASVQTTTFNICVTTPPPPPANDNCTGATSLIQTANGVCTNTAGTVLSATTSSQANTCSGTADDDVWYSFVATATSANVILSNIAGSTADLYHSVYSGTCGTIGAPLVCSDPNSSLITGLTIGNTYFVRVYTFTATVGQTSTFSICVSTPPPPITNDECVNAINVVVPGTGCNSTAGTVIGASASAQANTCFGTADDDVWFKFTATTTSVDIALNNVSGSTTDMYFSVYSGTCGTPGTPLICSDPEVASVSGLTIGSVYFVRIYTYTSTTGQTSTFNLCISPPPPPPANDECVGAITLPHEPFSSCTEASGTVTGATQSSVQTCGGIASNDVWFRFVATSTIADVRVNWIKDEVVQIYRGTCGGLISVQCQDTPEGSVVTTGLTIGNTYFVRVYGSITGNLNPSFSICISTTSTAINDDCIDAVTIAHETPNNCNLTFGTLNGATQTLADCSGGGVTARDVWYEFTATATTALVHRVSEVSNIVQVFTRTSTCGALTSLVCHNLDEDLSLSGLTIGSTYLLRLYANSSTIPTDPRFGICISTPQAITNTSCAAVVLPTCSSVVSYQAATGTTADPGNNYGCLFTQPNPAWFYVQSSVTGSLVLALESADDVDYAVWGPFSNPANANAACGTLPGPILCSYNSNKNETITIPNTIVGQVYIVLATNFANVVQVITLKKIGGSGSYDCVIVPLPVTLLSFSGKRMTTNQVKLSWETVQEVDNAGFEVEMSADARNFERIGFVTAQGNNKTVASYEMMHTNSVGGYFRLKQIDNNGQFVYSKIIYVDGTSESVIRIYPNPAIDNLTIDLGELKTNESAKATFRNMLGVVVSEKNLSQVQTDIALGHLAKGIYILEINKNGKKIIEKIVLQ